MPTKQSRLYIFSFWSLRGRAFYGRGNLNTTHSVVARRHDFCRRSNRKPSASHCEGAVYATAAIAFTVLSFPCHSERSEGSRLPIIPSLRAAGMAGSNRHFPHQSLRGRAFYGRGNLAFRYTQCSYLK